MQNQYYDQAGAAQVPYPPQSAAYGRTEVVVTDIKMPFWSMVVFILKWTLASIPAMIILFIVATLAFGIFSTFITALIHNLGGAAR